MLSTVLNLNKIDLEPEFIKYLYHYFKYVVHLKYLHLYNEVQHS